MLRSNLRTVHYTHERPQKFSQGGQSQKGPPHGEKSSPPIIPIKKSSEKAHTWRKRPSQRRKKLQKGHPTNYAQTKLLISVTYYIANIT